MFRNPRENSGRDPGNVVVPSVGRPPTPPTSVSNSASAAIERTTTTTLPQTTFVKSQSKPRDMSLTKTSPATPRPSMSKMGTPSSNNRTSSLPSSAKMKPKPNGNIMSFFKKMEPGSLGGPQPVSLFLEEQSPQKQNMQHRFNNLDSKDNEVLDEVDEEELSWRNQMRFNEMNSPTKRRKVSHSSANHDPETIPKRMEDAANAEHGKKACTPPPPDVDQDGLGENLQDAENCRHIGPFVDESDSEDEEYAQAMRVQASPEKRSVVAVLQEIDESSTKTDADIDEKPFGNIPPLKREDTSYGYQDGFADFEGMDDFEDEYPEGEEFVERRWMQRQRQLEMMEGGFEGELPDEEMPDGYLDDLSADLDPPNDASTSLPPDDSSLEECPVCQSSLKGISNQEASVHVNHCLDGNPTPLPTADIASGFESEVQQEGEEEEPRTAFNRFKRPARAPKPGQQNPFQLGTTAATSSAFSKLMSGHAESAAWATAAAAEHAARGKPAYQRTCPFYKILPGFFICVDAFRYGAVQGCNAYFLSHFHSDHYIGLTASWSHGPIYCSRPTANLVKQQLRVDPRWVKELEFDVKVEVPGTQGVFVNMIPANHCPGSSLYLFEKTVGKGANPKVQRVLHCGDFRACPAHIGHPLLRPEAIDLVSGKVKQQRIDVCYLDTTYLNPRYAFPSQEDVIQACADMCVSLNKSKVDSNDKWEKMLKERAGGSMVKFVSKEDDSTSINTDTAASKGAETEANMTSIEASSKTDYKDGSRGRLLVVVGTYSIGKERICLGIARALGSLIYAPPGKQRICACLEDKELSSRLTRDPRAAQVHMTPLFEIRAETLTDYLTEFRDTFSRAVGFRPSGWNYRPPGSRFTDSPAVSTVLYSDNWKSGYSVRDLVPQRGSTSRAKCFGVPYSEHSSFRELTMFCCALHIDKIIPTVNVGSAKGRERMKLWCERWAMERRKAGLFKVFQPDVSNEPAHVIDVSASEDVGNDYKGTGERDKIGERDKDKGDDRAGKNQWYPGKGTWELRTTL